MRALLRFLPEKLRHKLIRSRINLGTGAPTHIIFKLAETKEELEQAFRVLHDAYVSQGYMDPHPSGLRVTKYHALPTTAVLIAKDTRINEVVGTVSIVRNTPLGLPLDAVFPLEDLKQQYRHLAEVSSLAVKKEYRSDPAELLWPLLRYFYKYIREVMRVDAYVIGVNPSWHDLYVGILGFTKLNGFHSANYSFVNNAPVAGYLVNVIEQEFLFYKFYSHLPDKSNFFKYYRSHSLTRPQHQFPNRRYHSIQSTVMNKEFFDYFFVQKTDALKHFTPEEKVIIQHYYPVQDFAPIIFNSAPEGIRQVRGANRFITRFNAQLKYEGSYENDIHISVIDFSAKGLRVEASINLPDEMELRVGIGLYDSAYVKARVRRKFGRSWGLEITEHDQAWTDFIVEMQRVFEPDNLAKEISLQELSEKKKISKLNSSKRAS